ncbi:DUF6705 family protein [Chryseobacterium sp. MFBS3-17]|uniref:DUF6705 family protein n=1 Tax=Chryseobacterium sp. MFBS3-17 TaxID=2886689 RepID=UPI001D0F2751|nr:DUF6705 family protein [Chryseobacterium sp. MFBS3-17]MCC2591735.1 hypothetical protein [Chryseobacterium sp. MFBS3-17]
MKNIIILAIILLSTHSVKAQKGDLTFVEPPQQFPVTCDVYNQKQQHEKFTGVWQGSVNDKLLRIELKNVKIHLPTVFPNANFPNEECVDAIIGFHQFIDNGVEKENSLPYHDTTMYQKKWTVLGGNYNANIPNIIKGTLEHPSKNKSVKFVISYIDATHIKLESLENLQGTKLAPYDSSISLPQNIILTKQ